MLSELGLFGFKHGREGIQLNNLSVEVTSEWYFLPYCIPVTQASHSMHQYFLLFSFQFEFLSYVQAKDLQRRGTSFHLNIIQLLFLPWLDPD